MNPQQQKIREYIINLFEIDKLGEGEREESINKIGQIIFESVLTRILPIMSENDLKEYEKLINENVSAGTLMDFLNEKVPNFYEIITEEAEKAKSEMQNTK